ncbi:MAG TPA: serine/threonine-protein kinase [Sandaracinaceae bacterium LLY-WYZ-13_1]|nr:serine/threonine-protein kinase [Sandaracinaceae bacterium LLY-WYZ-13_1]
MSEGRSGPATASTARRAKGPDPLIGRVVNDRFRVVALLARGGMGKVYRAEQTPLGREVALKVLNPKYRGENDPEFHKRFFLEASTCSKLSHPNTVTIFDYGRTDDDIYFIAMELLEGRTLHRALREDGAFEPERAMHVARQVCRSLREAHSLGVIHRDLKPANVFLMQHGDETDFVKVLDFGLVKELETGEDLTQTGLFMGSPKYMSPEQIRGESVDARADVYALGVILYEMLTGGAPFDRPNSVNTLMAHVHEAPPALAEANPELAASPPGLEAVVMRALAKDPNARFSGMDEMLVALKDLATDAGLSVTHSLELPLNEPSGGATGRFPAGGAAQAELHAPDGADDATRADEHPPFSAPPPAMSAPPGPGRGAWPLVAAAIGACAVAAIAGVAWIATRDGATQTNATQTNAAPEPPPAPVPEPAPASAPGAAEAAPRPAATSTRVVLRSDPSGASVRVGDEVLGETPHEVEWTGAQARRGRRVTFRFVLDEHRDYAVTRVITSDRLEVEAQLEPIARRPRRRRRRRRRPEREDPNEALGAVEGYKLDPY